MTTQSEFHARMRIGPGTKEVAQLDLKSGILLGCSLYVHGTKRDRGYEFDLQTRGYEIGLQIIGENGTVIKTFGPTYRLRSYFIPKTSGRYRFVLDNSHSSFTSKDVFVALSVEQKPTEDNGQYGNHDDRVIVRHGEILNVNWFYSPRGWNFNCAIEVKGLDDKLDIIAGIRESSGEDLWRTDRIKSTSNSLVLPLEGVYEIYLDNSFSIFTDKDVHYRWSITNMSRKRSPMAPLWDPLQSFLPWGYYPR